MGKRLKDNLSSSYFQAANRLNSRSSRRRIVAYVESYDDVYFWRSILSQYENERLYFEVMLPTRSTHLERGKKAALMTLLHGKVGTDMIACVDADYDYLEQGATPTSKEILTNPYVFHTYAYAIENLQCYAPSLHEVCVAVTLNDHAIFDFEGFLKAYSQVIFPLFVWSVWYYRTPNYNEFTMTDLVRVIEIGNFSLWHVDEILGRVRRKVSTRAEQLRRQNPAAKGSYQQVKEELKTLGVTADNTYLYIQGHHLFNKVVVPVLSRVCDELVRERENEISRQSVHGIQRRNELSCYVNSLGDISSMLKKNMGFMRSEECGKICKDIETFLTMIGERPKEEVAEEGTHGASAGAAASV